MGIDCVLHRVGQGSAEDTTVFGLDHETLYIDRYEIGNDMAG